MKKYIALLLLVSSISFSQTITSISIVDSNGGIWWNLKDNDTVYLNKIPEKWSIYVTVSPTPYKVNFTFRSYSNSERLAPYALYGDGVVKSVPEGSYVLTATPYPTYRIDGTVGTTIRFTIAQPKPKLIAKFASWGYVPLVGQKVFLSTAIWDTVNRVSVDTVKSVRMLIDAPTYPASVSVLILNPPYFYSWMPAVAGKHIIRGEGVDKYGNRFLIQSDSLYVVTQRMVDTAKFVNKSINGYINAIIR